MPWHFWTGRVPSAAVTSRNDRLSFPRLAELQARYPSAQTHIFEEGAHTTLMLFPDLYNAELKRFLAAAYES